MKLKEKQHRRKLLQKRKATSASSSAAQYQPKRENAPSYNAVPAPRAKRKQVDSNAQPNNKRRRVNATAAPPTAPTKVMPQLEKATAIALRDKADAKKIDVKVQRKAGVSANWKQLCAKLPLPPSTADSASLHDGDDNDESAVSQGERKRLYKERTRERMAAKRAHLAFTVDEAPLDDARLTKVVGIDCEMVGVGIDGLESALARVSIVNSFGNVLLDTFVQPLEPVVDYRTRWSGVREHDLRDAPTFADVQRRVAEIFKGRIIVGHSLENDLHALLLTHPRSQIRDTALYRPLQRRRGVPHSLKTLTAKFLDVAIQRAEHSSVEDARAALLLYQMHKTQWEAQIRRKIKSRPKKKSKKKQSVQPPPAQAEPQAP